MSNNLTPNELEPNELEYIPSAEVTKVSCCDDSGSPGMLALAKHIDACKAGKRETLDIHFDHGLGDVVHFAAILRVLEKRYGIKVRIFGEPNKRAAWEAAGIELLSEVAEAPYHRWTYPPDFNFPGARYDGAGSKIFGNIFISGESLTERQEIYRDVCNLDMRDWLPQVIPGDVQSQIDKWLKGLPKPYVLLHTTGTNFPDGKNVGDHNALYESLLDSFDGTLILLDWDFRIEYFPHSRIRHIKHSLGHIDLYQLGAIYNAAHASNGLLIGVDSGPFHFAAMHPINALGVFHHHYPACVTLPSAKNVVMTRNAESYKPCNLLRRKEWNIVEYDGEKPSTAAIVRQACRMLAGPRYSWDSPIGNDVMLQQWVLDWSRQNQSLSQRADRDTSFDFILKCLRSLRNPQIVETGCIRSAEDWSAGYSTYLFAAYLSQRENGNLISVDNDALHIATAKKLIEPWDKWKKCRFVKSDSIKFLKGYDGAIDVLFLDSLDTYELGCAEHGLAEFQAAEHCLTPLSLVVYDDTTYDKNEWKGKGALGVPYLLGNGWKAVSCGYQVVLQKGV
jgi:hypothetical protein